MIIIITLQSIVVIEVTILIYNIDYMDKTLKKAGILEPLACFSTVWM